MAAEIYLRSSSLSSTTTVATAAAASKDPVPFKWPLVMYLAVLLGAPYLTWKLISSTAIEVEEEKKPESWMKGKPLMTSQKLSIRITIFFFEQQILISQTVFHIGEEDHFVGQALYDFSAQSLDELGFRSGETLLVAPKELQPKIRY